MRDFSLPNRLRVVSEARRAMRLHEHGVFARFRYNPRLRIIALAAGVFAGGTRAMLSERGLRHRQ